MNGIRVVAVNVVKLMFPHTAGAYAGPEA